MSKIENVGKEVILIWIKGFYLRGKIFFKNRLLNNKLVINNKVKVVDIDLVEYFSFF